jgi:hypothetical protein
VAYGRALPAGAVLEGTVLMPGQLDQELPYDPEPANANISAIKSIVFSVGYAEADPNVVPNEIKAGAELVLSLPYAWLITHQRMLNSEATALTVPMR